MEIVADLSEKISQILDIIDETENYRNICKKRIKVI